MARGTRIVGLNTYMKKWEKNAFDYLVEQQTLLLVDYAKDLIDEIGIEINSYNSRNNMDRTGNLLDSLCWGVSYQGQLQASGFFRPQTARDPSGLHEWSYAEFEHEEIGNWRKGNADDPVNGHALAAEYIQKYGNKPCKGWKVFFAILAPYWGYWEKGFALVHGMYGMGGYKPATFKQFAVMAHFFDRVKKDLKPARVRYRVSVPKYASKSLVSRARKNFYGKSVPKIKAHYFG